jgi:hypothetical protein
VTNVEYLNISNYVLILSTAALQVAAAGEHLTENNSDSKEDAVKTPEHRNGCMQKTLHELTEIRKLLQQQQQQQI